MEENADPSKQGEVGEGALMSLLDDAFLRTFQMYHKASQQRIENLQMQLDLERKKLKEEQNKLEILKQQQEGSPVVNSSHQKEVDVLQIQVQDLQSKLEKKGVQENFLQMKAKRARDDILQIDDKLQQLNHDSMEGVVKRDKLIQEKLEVYEELMNNLVQTLEEKGSSSKVGRRYSDNLKVSKLSDSREGFKLEECMKVRYKMWVKLIVVWAGSGNESADKCGVGGSGYHFAAI